MKLYSYRWTTAKGWQWKLERDCDKDTADQWLEYFIKSEPEVEFRLSETKPKEYKKQAPKLN